MDAQRIAELYRYNAWAAHRVLDAAAALTREQFVATIPSSFPSIRDTLVHVLWAEWIWLERWNGRSPKTVFDPHDFPDATALRARWADLEEKQRAFLGSLTEELLATVIRYVNRHGETWEYELWKQMLHVVNHSSYHRGQVITMLRQLGAPPPTTDFLVFYDEMGA
jgi:uncharacterized damage-inducible protein DinB